MHKNAVFYGELHQRENLLVYLVFRSWCPPLYVPHHPSSLSRHSDYY